MGKSDEDDTIERNIKNNSEEREAELWKRVAI